jgi:sarcosine oxidase subunit gamma
VTADAVDQIPSGPAPGLSGLRRSALAHRAADLEAVSTEAGVALVELPFLAMVSLRVDPASEVAVRVERALGLTLPGPGTVASAAIDEAEAVLPGEGGEDGLVGQYRSALWLGPDEWLVVGPDGDAAGLAGLLVEAVADGPGSVVEVSANRDTLVISGPRARELLEKGCTLDLHPRSFRAGQCAQTTFARGHVLIWQTADEERPGGPVYRLLFRGSFGNYFADWLTDAAVEFS